MSDFEQKDPNAVNSVPVTKPSKYGEIIDYIEILIIAICVVLAIFSFSGIRLCTVSGPSMEQTLTNGENLITSNVMYEPERGDIIVFHQTADTEPSFNEPIVKRVIGLPGDTVYIDNFSSEVIVVDKNGNTVDLGEDNYKYVVDSNPYAIGYMAVKVEEGTVFVMGDNRNHSADSRDQRIALVDTRRILGKVIFRATPFSKIGPVE